MTCSSYPMTNCISLKRLSQISSCTMTPQTSHDPGKLFPFLIPAPTNTSPTQYETCLTQAHWFFPPATGCPSWLSHMSLAPQWCHAWPTPVPVSFHSSPTQCWTEPHLCSSQLTSLTWSSPQSHSASPSLPSSLLLEPFSHHIWLTPSDSTCPWACLSCPGVSPPSPSTALPSSSYRCWCPPTTVPWPCSQSTTLPWLPSTLHSHCRWTLFSLAKSGVPFQNSQLSTSSLK